MSKAPIYEQLVRDLGDPGQHQGHDERVAAIIERRTKKKRKKTTPASSSAATSP